MSTAAQGHDFRGLYYHEDNGFASNPNDSTAKALGADATVGRAEGTNNAVQVFQPGTRIPIDIIERLFEGSFQLTFTYTNPWWLNFVYGAPSTTDNGDGSYTHTWDGETPQSQRVVIGREQSGKERVLKGCVAASASISTQVNGNAEVTIRGAYAKETVDDPASITSQPAINEKPMTFADAALDLGGTTLGYVQQGTIELNNQVELINEWGTRTAIDFAPRTLIPSLNFRKINEAGEVDNLQDFYGSSGSTSIQNNITNNDDATITYDNGNAAGSGINKAVFNLNTTFPDRYGEEGLGDPTADVIENINRLVEDVTVDATNEVSSAK